MEGEGEDVTVQGREPIQSVVTSLFPLYPSDVLDLLYPNYVAMLLGILLSNWRRLSVEF